MTPELTLKPFSRACLQVFLKETLKPVVVMLNMTGMKTVMRNVHYLQGLAKSSKEKKRRKEKNSNPLTSFSLF